MLFTRLLLSLVLPAALAAPSDPVVETASGKVRGVLSPGGVQVYRGIPYAEPPTGPLRWQAPVPHAPWSNVYAATQDGAGCPQQCRLPAITCPPVQSEDCLFLNVFVPPSVSPNAGVAAKAVMFWIHGGDFYQGYGGGILYDGTVLAKEQDVVVVAINYRLGALGFLYTGPDKDTQFTGNFGLLDQQLAMRWVQENIANFGGDPEMVTIFGQSAGGASVASHLNMPSSKGLFSRAILQSNPVGLPFRTADKAPDFAAFVAKDAGCAGKRIEPCMRALPWKQVLAAAVTAESNLFIEIGNFLSLFQPYSPVVGTLCSCAANGYFMNGTSLNVPTLVGSVQQEGLIFIYEAFSKGPTSRCGGCTDGNHMALIMLIRFWSSIPAISRHDMRNHTTNCDDSLFLSDSPHLAAHG